MPLRTFVVNSSHYIPNSNNMYRFPLINNPDLTGCKIGVQTASIYNSTFNIRQAWGNNTFTVAFPNIRTAATSEANALAAQRSVGQAFSGLATATTTANNTLAAYTSATASFNAATAASVAAISTTATPPSSLSSAYTAAADALTASTAATTVVTNATATVTAATATTVNIVATLSGIGAVVTAATLAQSTALAAQTKANTALGSANTAARAAQNAYNTANSAVIVATTSTISTATTARTSQNTNLTAANLTVTNASKAYDQASAIYIASQTAYSKAIAAQAMVTVSSSNSQTAATAALNSKLTTAGSFLANIALALTAAQALVDTAKLATTLVTGTAVLAYSTALASRSTAATATVQNAATLAASTAQGNALIAANNAGTLTASSGLSLANSTLSAAKIYASSLGVSQLPSATSTTMPYLFYTQYTFTFPDSYMSISDMNYFIQAQCIANGLYAINSLGQYVYFVEMVVNTTQYAAQLNIYPIPLVSSAAAGGLTAAAGGTLMFQTSLSVLPTVQFPQPFGNLLGLNALNSSVTNGCDTVMGFNGYGGPLCSTAQSILSAFTPNINPVNSYVIACNLLNNPYTIPNNIFYTIPLTSSIGSLVVVQASDPVMNDIAPNHYDYIQLTLFDQNLNPLYLQDTEMTLTLALSDNKVPLTLKSIGMLG